MLKKSRDGRAQKGTVRTVPEDLRERWMEYRLSE
jgi:hypothetical protein